jgi:Cu-Zn family superoxide dismutase
MPARALLLVRLAVAALLVSLAGGLSAVAQDATPSTGGPEPVEVALSDATGADAGTATFTENADGTITISVNAQGLPEGDHGIHVHARGLCDPSGEQPFTTAGPHYNPTGGMHDGPPAEAEMATPGGDPTLHAGDFGNITAAGNGSATLEVTTGRFTLSDGPRSLNDSDGSALVIHMNPDDLTSQPSGASGGRIVCGVIAAPQEPMGTPIPATPEVATVEASVFSPEQVPFSEELMAQLQLP